MVEINVWLRKHKEEITKKFGVERIGIFGSYAKGNAKEESDLDILVVFYPQYKTFDNYMDLKFFLEEALGEKIDLVTEGGLKERLKDRILKEVVYV